MNPRLLIPLFCMLLLTTFFSCVDTAPTKEVQHIDSLNSWAYMYRYRDLDSSCKAASQAYKEVSMYSQGKAEASNNLAFCAFMRMDFDTAERLHKGVDRKSTRLNSSHLKLSRMPSSA